MYLLLRFTEGVTQPERNETIQFTIKIPVVAMSLLLRFTVRVTQPERNETVQFTIKYQW